MLSHEIAEKLEALDKESAVQNALGTRYEILVYICDRDSQKGDTCMQKVFSAANLSAALWQALKFSFDNKTGMED